MIKVTTRTAPNDISVLEKFNGCNPTGGYGG